MNYKISTGILATTPVFFATAFIISLIYAHKKPDFPNFPEGNLQEENFMKNGVFNRLGFGEGEFPTESPDQKPADVESQL